MSAKNKCLVVLTLSLLLAAFLAGAAYAQPGDVKGHWAENKINAWVFAGLISGYPDGTFQPDKTITRAEFAALANRACGYTAGAELNFPDVKPADWFYGEVARAKAAGYISGYEDGTFRPNNPISRQEIASVIAKILKLDRSATGGTGSFADASGIPQWSRASISAVTAKGYMKGYPDNTFQPAKAITRAEAVAALHQSIGINITYAKAGTYGPAAGTGAIEGNVTIGASGVTLQNTVITGNLLLAEGIGEGDVTLKNVAVKGTTTVKGGGSHSVVFENCTMPSIIVSRDGVRIVASGSTSVNVVRLESGATLVEVSATGPGFGQVTVSEVIPAGSAVTLAGSFEAVGVAAGNIQVAVESGTVSSLTVAANAAGSTINLDARAAVTSLTLNAASQVTGQGTIGRAEVNAAGSTIQQSPASVTLAGNVTVTVNSRTVSQNTSASTTTGGGGGSGGGGGGGNSRSLSYSAATFNEAAANNGGIDNTTPVAITLSGDSFTGNNGDDFIAGGKITVTNLPAGLAVAAQKTGATTLSVTITGNANTHSNANDVSSLTFTFQNGAFTGGSASGVTNYAKNNLVINFLDPSATALPKVAQPTLSASGVAGWTDVANETGYEVKLLKNGVAVATESLGANTVSYDLLTAMRSNGAGAYTVTVQAKGDGAAHLDGPVSDPSAAQTVAVLAQAGELSWTGDAISWGDVANESGYQVILLKNSVAVDTQNKPANSDSHDFTATIAAQGAGSYTATVQAKGSGLYLDGPASTASAANVKQAILNQVDQPTLSSSGVATWTNVANASGYEVQLYKDGLAQGEAVTEADGAAGHDFLAAMRSAGAGAYTVKVTAKGNGVTYQDGPQSVASAVQTVAVLAQVVGTIWDYPRVYNGDGSYISFIDNPQSWVYWANVDNAANYEVQLYKNGSAQGMPVTIVDGSLGYDFLNIMRASGVGAYTVKVTAKGTGLYLDGAQSLASGPQTVAVLEQVGQPVWDGETIRWVDVTNEDGYEVILLKNGVVVDTEYAGENIISCDFTITIAAQGAGSYTATVRARSFGLYLDGPVSTASAAYNKTATLAQVSQPSLSDMGVASWTDVNNETGYEVKLYDSLNAVISTQTVGAGTGTCDFLSEMRSNGVETYHVTVKAKGDGVIYLDGLESTNSNTRTVQGLNQVILGGWAVNRKMTWTDVANESSYELKLYKQGTVDPIDTRTLASGIEEYDYFEVFVDYAPGSFYATVQAKGTGLYLDGPVSLNSPNLDQIAILAKPAKPTLSGTGLAEWQSVPNATSYYVTLYKDSAFADAYMGNVLSRDFSASVQAAGTYTVTVMAVGDHTTYADGPASVHSDPLIVP